MNSKHPHWLNWHWLNWCLLALLVLLTGCQEPPASIQCEQKFCESVSGRVYLDGEPLTGALVLFVPEFYQLPDLRLNPFSYAITDKSGHYDLILSKELKGAICGKHRIALSMASLAKPHLDEKPKQPPTIPNEIRESPTRLPSLSQLLELSNEQNQLFGNFLMGQQRWREPIPSKYNHSSTLSCNIASIEPVIIDFDLKSEID